MKGPLIASRIIKVVLWEILFWIGIHHSLKMWFCGGNVSQVRRWLFQALLGPETIEEEGIFLRDALMKVCIKKPGLSSILQFDCEVHSTGDDSSDFEIDDACYLQSSTCLGPSVYRGPFFDTLEIPLQDALKQYLKARGIGESLTNFLLLHLNKKEQHQYVNWLHKLEAVVTNGD
ncbi:hypothetical protein L1049_007831 [Liquidambar formosana]|uniref:Mitochondrial glycoprotein n=1 Tax=Liquidambar formosana TaxID=63359 RepID=A0AAP0X7T3_LIQFO